jgi:DHA2 family multidrug resistance protein
MIGLGIWCLFCTRHPIIDLTCMKDRNLAVSCALIFLLLISQYGAILSIPQLVAGIFGYDAVASGKLTTYCVIPSLLAMPIAGALSARIGLKGVAMLGVIIQVIGYHGMWNFYFDTDFWTIWFWYLVFWVGVNFLQFCAMTLALAWQPQRLVNDASSLYNVIKFTGAGVGIGAASIIGAQRTQFWTQRTGELLNPYRDEVNTVLSLGGDASGNAATTPAAMLLGEQGTQVSMLNYIDTFFVFTLISASLLICILAMKDLPTAEQKEELERQDAELARRMRAADGEQAGVPVSEAGA